MVDELLLSEKDQLQYIIPPVITVLLIRTFYGDLGLKTRTPAEDRLLKQSAMQDSGF